MENKQGKCSTYLKAVIKNCNLINSVIVGFILILMLVFIDGFDLLSRFMATSKTLQISALILLFISGLGVLFTIIMGIAKKTINGADKLITIGAFTFVFALVYVILSSSSFLLLKWILVWVLFVSVIILALIRMLNFSEEPSKKEQLPKNAISKTYYKEFLSRFWPFAFMALIVLISLIFIFEKSNLFMQIINVKSVKVVFITLGLMLLLLLVSLYTSRIKEKEINFIDVFVFSLTFASFLILPVALTLTKKNMIISFIVFAILLLILIPATIGLIKNTHIYSEKENYVIKHDTHCVKVYFNVLAKKTKWVMIFTISSLVSLIICVVNATSLFSSLVTAMSGVDVKFLDFTLILICAICLLIVFSDALVHKVGTIDYAIMSLFIISAFSFVLLVIVSKIAFMPTGIVAIVGMSLSVVLILIRCLVAKAGAIQYQEEILKDCEETLDEVVNDEAQDEVSCNVDQGVQSQETKEPQTDCQEVIENCEDEVGATSENDFEDDESDNDSAETTAVKRVVVKKTFEVYLRTSDEQLKQNYSEIKNELLKYGLTSRMTKLRETFSKKGVSTSKLQPEKFLRQHVKIQIRGKVLKVYLNIEPSSISEKYFRHKDVSDKMPDQPTFVKVRSKLTLKRVLELIEMIAKQENFTPKKKFTPVNYAEIYTDESLTYMEKMGYDYIVKDSVTIEEANLINDEFAEKVVKTKLIQDPARYIYDEITLKDLEDNFEDGQVITLEELRSKGIIKINANHLTIKPSEKLSKKFIVEAHSILPKAVTMIVIAGGEVTRLIGE